MCVCSDWEQQEEEEEAVALESWGCQIPLGARLHRLVGVLMFKCVFFCPQVFFKKKRVWRNGGKVCTVNQNYQLTRTHETTCFM